LGTENLSLYPKSPREEKNKGEKKDSAVWKNWMGVGIVSPVRREVYQKVKWSSQYAFRSRRVGERQKTGRNRWEG